MSFREGDSDSAAAGTVCPHCDEQIAPEDEVRDGRHRECFIRIILGSAAHQLGECPCFGGTRRDPSSLTTRGAALLAYDVYVMRLAALEQRA